MASVQVSLQRLNLPGLMIQTTNEQLTMLAGERWLVPLLDACACGIAVPQTLIPQTLVCQLEPTNGSMFHLVQLLQDEVQHSAQEPNPYARAIAKVLTIHLLRLHSAQALTDPSTLRLSIHSSPCTTTLSERPASK